MLTKATANPDAKTVHRDHRLRAVYRRELQESVRFSALVIAAGIAVSAVYYLLTEPDNGLLYAAVNFPLVAAGLTAAAIVRRKGRRYVVPLGMATGLLPAAATALSIVLIGHLQLIAIATSGFVAIAFAIFIPLQRRDHLVWLVLVNAVFFGITSPTLASSTNPSQPSALVFSAVLATVLSIGANEVQLRRRREMDRQLLAVRGLYSRMKEHEIDLRRQDEFLFMQQETLVVQQAELLRLNEELESIARLDALTGLGNRLRLNEDLAALAARIERSGGAAGILLMDLDRFKRLNDCDGHLAGDAALRGVSDVMRKVCRAGDGVYRYGGEEFLVLLHDCDESGLQVAGQRYLTAIEAAGMAHPDNPPYGLVTASAGATELSQANCTDVDSALHDADEALYVAKGTGRNRLHIHERSVPTALIQIDQQRAAS